MPVLTPASLPPASLVLSDGTTEMELIGDGEGTYVVVDGFELPAPAPENTYVETPDSEGRRRIRTRYQNVEGGVIRLRVDFFEDLHAPFWEEVDSLLELVMSAHRQKGTLTYEPTEGATLTYDLESIYVSDLPQKGWDIVSKRYEPTITFECKPFARLEPVELFADEAFSGPVDSVVIDNIPGHADALVDFNLVDNSSEESGWVEVTVERDGYVVGADLLYDSSSLTAMGSTAGTTRTDAYSASGVKRQTLGTAVTDFVSIENLTHHGRKRISGRFYAEEDSWVQSAYKLGGGEWSYGPWRRVLADDFREIHLQTADIREAPDSHAIDIKLRAYADVVGNFDIDYLEILGGERRCLALLPGNSVLQADGNIQFLSDSVVKGASYATTEGNFLTLPPSTRGSFELRLAVRRRRNEIDEADAGVTDSMLGTLEVTPRVALVGE